MRGRYGLRLSLAASSELRSQMLSDVTMMPDGAGGFTTGPNSPTQFYVPRVLRIGLGRGVNTAGAVRSSGQISGEPFRAKAPTARTPGARRYRG